MPKSKRNKQVELSKTRKKGLEGKKELVSKIQSSIENYAHVFVFRVNDMRNAKMKHIREQWKHSRFFIGKNRVMARALGRTPEEAYRPNLHKIAEQLKGEKGLLFTNQSVEEVTKFFASYSESDYARSGNVAIEDVVLKEGPLSQFPHSLESHLRQLGLPTTLKKGVIHLLNDFVVCREGDRLTPEASRLLKLLGYEMAEFRIAIESVFSKDGTFTNLNSSEEKENSGSLLSGVVEIQNDDDDSDGGDDDEEEEDNNAEEIEMIPIGEEIEEEVPEKISMELKTKKFSPRLTRSRAAAKNIKIKTPEDSALKSSSRKKKV